MKISFEILRLKQDMVNSDTKTTASVEELLRTFDERICNAVQQATAVVRGGCQILLRRQLKMISFSQDAMDAIHNRDINGSQCFA